MDLRVEDLPFRRREPHDLFGIVPGRIEPDLSGNYTEHGWVRLDEIALADHTGSTTLLRDVLVVALHSPDLDNPLASDDEPEVELELRVGTGPNAELVAVIVPLLRFLDARATDVIGDARDVLLAWCNPRRLRPSAPAWLDATRRLHFACGDVVSWLDPLEDGRTRFRLAAESWHTIAGAASPAR